MSYTKATAKLSKRDLAEITRRVELEVEASKNGARGRVYTTLEPKLVTDMHIDPDAQREQNPERVEEMVRAFDPLAIGVLYVSQRKTGELFIMDGGHRHKTLVRVGWADQLVDCKIYHGLTLIEEAALFLKFAKRVNLNPLRGFQIRLTSHDEVACMIRQTCESLNLKIASGPGTNHITAVRALEKVFTGSDKGRYPHVLRDTLKVIRSAFQSEQMPFTGVLIGAVGLLLHHGQGGVDLDRLTKVLSKTGGSAQMEGLGKTQHQTRSGSIPKATAEAMRMLYNQGVRLDANRIPSLYKQ